MDGNSTQVFLSRMRTRFFERAEMFDSSRPWYVDTSDMSFRAGAGRIRLDDDGLFVVDNQGTPRPVLTAISTASTVNSESLGVGDVMIGDNSSGVPNLLFDQSAGELHFRIGSSSVPIRFSSNGLVVYGGTGFGSSTAINFFDASGSLRIGEIYGYTTGSSAASVSMRTRVTDNTREPFVYTLSAVEHASGGEASAFSGYVVGRISDNGDGTFTVYTPRAFLYTNANTSTDYALCTLYSVSGDETAYLDLVSDDAATSCTISADTFSVTGGGSKGFKIDHPVHPLSMWLHHAAIESDERRNIYGGVVTLNDAGAAVVEMPEWFKSISRDPVPAVTALDQPAPNLHASADAIDRSPLSSYVLRIDGGNPGQRVAWQMMTTRDDQYARRFPYVVEEPKRGDDVGHVASAKAFGRRQMFSEKPRRNDAPPGYTTRV